jgi:hypothetical protein
MVMHRVRTVFSGVPGTPWLSTFYFAAAIDSAQDAASAAGGFWGAVDALINTAVDWTTEADVSQIDEDTGNLVGVTSTSPVAGVGALNTEMGPLVSQGLIRWRTGAVINGRNLRGRTFIPGLCVSSQDDGGVVSTTLTTINAAASALISSADSELVIWHRPPTPGASGGAAAPVVTGNMWNQYASMRSRRD